MTGADISSLGPAERSRRGLHRTFQRVQTFGWLSVEDNVLAATEWHVAVAEASLLTWWHSRQGEAVSANTSRIGGSNAGSV